MTPPFRRKSTIGRDKALDHRHRDLFRRHRRREAIGLRMHLGIDEQFAMEGSRQFDRKLHRLVVGDRTKSEPAHDAPPSGSRIRSRVTRTRSAKAGRLVWVEGKRVVWGKSGSVRVDNGGRRIIKKKKKNNTKERKTKV